MIMTSIWDGIFLFSGVFDYEKHWFHFNFNNDFGKNLSMICHFSTWQWKTKTKTIDRSPFLQNCLSNWERRLDEMNDKLIRFVNYLFRIFFSSPDELFHRWVAAQQSAPHLLVDIDGYLSIKSFCFDLIYSPIGSLLLDNRDDSLHDESISPSFVEVIDRWKWFGTPTETIEMNSSFYRSE